MLPRINLQPTHRLHQQLIATAVRDETGYRKISRSAAEVLEEQGTKFEGDTVMAFALSALCLDRSSMAALQSVAETLHGVVEKAIDWVLASPERVAAYFPDHMRMRPWLRKTRGLMHWQGVSRYDAVLRADGSVRIMELNTGCPAGFMHAEDFSSVTQEALRKLRAGGGTAGAGLGLESGRFGTIPAPALIEDLLAMESQAKIPKRQVGLINDENTLQNELELIAQAFRRRGRDVEIMNAADICRENGQSLWRGQPVSLMYNKIRISTANSPKHHWSPGFETRYAGFLDAIRHDAAVAVNNLAALTIAEDKGMLEVLRLPAFSAELAPEQQEFVNEYVLWTVRLTDREVDWHGRLVDLLPFVRANRERFVIKPANEGRGFGVVVGKFASEEAWDAACQVRPDLPCVVQEYAEPARLPVLRLTNGEGLKVRDHYLTVGLAMIAGQSRGVLSRISANPVTNVGREGVVQAVFLTK